MNLADLTSRAIEAALKAGSEIMTVYNSAFAIENKADNSPLTMADKKGHEAIAAHLESCGIPMLSEEGREISYEERRNWKQLWIVDPLDGTKEFIKRNGEFTVNIALIEDQVPVLGVIYVPVKEVLYFGNKEIGSYKVAGVKAGVVVGKTVSKWQDEGRKLPEKQGDRPFCIVGSRSHMSKETEDFIAELEQKHGKADVVSMGSSLKICLVAEGVADIYPRFAPTMEWDTAAGNAIAKYAGKELIDHQTRQPMLYNRENLLNNWFLVN